MQDTAPPGAVVGVGVDMETIARIRSLLGRPRFLLRFFGAEERAQLAARADKPAAAAAACFCAKEAFGKALGTGVRGFRLDEVQLLREPSGKPVLALSGRAAALADGLNFEVSISHTRDTAIAFVVASRDDGFSLQQTDPRTGTK